MEFKCSSQHRVRVCDEIKLGNYMVVVIAWYQFHAYSGTGQAGLVLRTGC